MSTSAAAEKKGAGVGEGKEPPLLIGPETVARMFGCSRRHLKRLGDAGQMPRPVKLGSKLIRWSRAEIEAWISGGCGSVRKEA